MNNYAVWEERRNEIIAGSIVSIITMFLALYGSIDMGYISLGNGLCVGAVGFVAFGWIVSTIIAIYHGGEGDVVSELIHLIMEGISGAFAGFLTIFEIPVVGLIIAVLSMMLVILCAIPLAVLFAIKLVAFPIETIVYFVRRNN